jgi:hypothetical protein
MQGLHVKTMSRGIRIKLNYDSRIECQLDKGPKLHHLVSVIEKSV